MILDEELNSRELGAERPADQNYTLGDVENVCMTCGGTGRMVMDIVCPSCHGTGNVVSAIKSAIQPSDGGAFDRTVSGYMPAKFPVKKLVVRTSGIEHMLCRLTEAHNADRAADRKRIAELEAKVPKDVVPHESKINGMWFCDCGRFLAENFPAYENHGKNFCPVCGARLNWEDGL